MREIHVFQKQLVVLCLIYFAKKLAIFNLIFASTFNDYIRRFSVDIEKYALSFKKRPKTG